MPGESPDLLSSVLRKKKLDWLRSSSEHRAQRRPIPSVFAIKSTSLFPDEHATRGCARRQREFTCRGLPSSEPRLAHTRDRVEQLALVRAMAVFCSPSQPFA